MEKEATVITGKSEQDIGNIEDYFKGFRMKIFLEWLKGNFLLILFNIIIMIIYLKKLY